MIDRSDRSSLWTIQIGHRGHSVDILLYMLDERSISDWIGRGRDGRQGPALVVISSTVQSIKGGLLGLPERDIRV